jgi:hypothetical protein
VGVAASAWRGQEAGSEPTRIDTQKAWSGTAAAPMLPALQYELMRIDMTDRRAAPPMSDQQASNDLSLERIENDRWGEPPTDATRLIATVHQLRRKPVRLLDAEDLRVLVAQKVGLGVLMPRALAGLEHEPLLEGDFYPGDVLVAVLRIPKSYWSAHPELRGQIERIVSAIDDPDVELKADIEAFRAGTRE